MRRFGRALPSRLGSLVAVAGLLAGCGVPSVATPTPAPTQPPVIPLPTNLPDRLTYEEALPLFEYDRTVPLNVASKSTWMRGNSRMVEIEYLGATGGLVPAYLVVPAGEGPFAGVVWMGWTGDFEQIRKEFVDEAFGMAERGVASLLVSGYFPWYMRPSDKDADRMGMIGQIRELRRAIDVLGDQAPIDANRIGFVGHSMGAMHGASLVAVDRRVKTAVLMTPNPTMTEWIFDGYGLDPTSRDSYEKAMASFDPIAFVPHTAPSSVFYQFGSDDPFVSLAGAQRLYDAAAEPKQIGWYGGGHDLDEVARRDRDDWLSKKLGLG